MRIAVCSDELYPVGEFVTRRLSALGHEVLPFGALLSGGEVPWPIAAEQASLAVQSRQCETGVFFCWSGTGICMAANKLFGIRAALCFDAATARAARVWNDANVLCLSNRMLSNDIAEEILQAWFSTPHGDEGRPGSALLVALDERNRRRS